MRLLLFCAWMCSLSLLFGQKNAISWLDKLPTYPGDALMTIDSDWLVEDEFPLPLLFREGKDLILTNGLAKRSFRMEPAIGMTDLIHLQTGENFVRAVRPEAWLMLDSVWIPVGGLSGQKDQGYLQRSWLDEMQAQPDGFQLDSIAQGPCTAPFSWTPTRWYVKEQWPPAGLQVKMYYGHPQLPELQVTIHYELYQGIPLFAKWLTLENRSTKAVQLNRFIAEQIAFPETQNPVETPERWQRPLLYAESDYAFGGFTYNEANTTIHWERDSSYTSQVNYLMQTPCVMESKLPVGPEISLEPGETFTSFRTFELLLDSYERERRSLSIRRMYETLAPWSTENPIFMHLTSTDPHVVKTAIDQCVEVGYEMVILSFGSGLNMEDLSEENLAKFKALADYAHERGIELGGYSLFSSRKIGPETDVIDLETGEPGGAKFGNAPCLGSEWGVEYLEKLRTFFEETGFDLLEHDGPYPGDYCASTTHPGHEGYHDSQFRQWEQTTAFYQWLRERDIYLNAPDFYFYNGSNKCGIGYREVNWSLPRDQQIILGRQNLYDGTWTRNPGMAWTFVALVEYHGGGEAATLEPLGDHLDAYEAHMVQNYGSGVQACYRGPRLYDTEATKALVQQQIDHYRRYRDILNSSLIHLRRPDGRDWDGFLHVNPNLNERGYALLFNPTDQAMQRELSLPLYYTGLTESATIRELASGRAPQLVELDGQGNANLSVFLPARGYVRLLITR
ncbi:MAG: alpha-galactosidase [Bacteroidota bacterium]